MGVEDTEKSVVLANVEASPQTKADTTATNSLQSVDDDVEKLERRASVVDEDAGDVEEERDTKDPHVIDWDGPNGLFTPTMKNWISLLIVFRLFQTHKIL